MNNLKFIEKRPLNLALRIKKLQKLIKIPLHLLRKLQKMLKKFNEKYFN